MSTSTRIVPPDEPGTAPFGTGKLAVRAIEEMAGRLERGRHAALPHALAARRRRHPDRPGEEAIRHFSSAFDAVAVLRGAVHFHASMQTDASSSAFLVAVLRGAVHFHASFITLAPSPAGCLTAPSATMRIATGHSITLLLVRSG